MKKKILSLLVTGCLLFVPTTAFADDNKTVIKTEKAEALCELSAFFICSALRKRKTFRHHIQI